MRLEQLNTPNTALKALKANFDFNLDVAKLDKTQTRDMLVKFHNVIKEFKIKNTHDSHNNPKYLQAVLLAEALANHYNSFQQVNIIVENEEVEKSQVILAAQDLVDQIQKMVEQVNDMLVKELPALSDSIQSEIGAQEGAAYNEAATGALTQLNQTLSQTRTTLSEALNQLTGMGGDMMAPAGAPAGGEEVAVTDIGAGPGGEEVAGAEMEMPPAPEMPAAPAEPTAGGGVGRTKR